jgi:uncharacterized protein YxjI
VRFVLQPSDLDVFITDGSGRDVCWVQGPSGRVGCWSLRSLAGEELATIRQYGSPFLPRFAIHASGQLRAELREQPARHIPRAAAALRNALVGAPSRIRYALDAVGEEPLRIEGDAAALEYVFAGRDRPAATVSAYWLPASAAWGATVTVDDPDPLVILAAAATIEISWGRMGHRLSRRSRVPSPSRP